ncbi:MAG: Asp-tRNA(Asn)/Glu-tRNA(Gln) amidotransferase GatCAB subunit C [Spirochaetaceae bacterium]|nr:MAG: Asp-tRNA(Asn)/Glu-tRNA(Gln) amidotransferase GatCAB subunit C [Spirochaetaceae bacterium]
MDSLELRTTADMAMLDLDDSGLAELEDAVSRVLEYFTTMAAIDVKNVEPTTHALITGNRTRRDQPASLALADDVLEQAADLEDRLISIPNVL